MLAAGSLHGIVEGGADVITRRCPLNCIFCCGARGPELLGVSVDALLRQIQHCLCVAAWCVRAPESRGSRKLRGHGGAVDERGGDGDKYQRAEDAGYCDEDFPCS